MQKVIVFHGLDDKTALKVMRAAKSVLDDPKSVAFAMSTETNLKWPLEKLVEEVWADHEYLMKNPPKNA